MAPTEATVLREFVMWLIFPLFTLILVLLI
jgi:hypothetical protein